MAHRGQHLIFAVGAIVLAPAGQANTELTVNSLRLSIESYVDESQTLADSLRENLRRLDFETSKGSKESDRRTVVNHYARIRETYLATPLKEQIKELENLKERVAKGQRSAISTALPLATGDKDKQKDFNNCLAMADGSLDSLIKTLQAAQGQIAREADTRSAGSEWERLLGTRQSFQDQLNRLDNSSLSRGHIYACCQNKINPVPLESTCQALADAAMNALLVDGAGTIFSSAVTPPNPLADLDNIEPFELAQFMRDRAFLRELAEVRSTGDIEERAAAEADLYQTLDSQCKKARGESQSGTSPVDKALISNLGKTLKCAVFPALATTYLDTEFQRLVTGIGASQVEANGYDFSCDPREMALYDQMRPMDPNQIAQQWGIPQLGNPPYIQSLRTLPPLSSPFPVAPLPGGGYATPFGAIAAPQPQTVVTSGATRSARRSSYTRSSSAGRRPVRASRGLVQGQSMVRGVRGFAADISRGVQSESKARTLRSGAAATRSFAATMATNTAKTAPATRRANSAAKAKNITTVVRGLTTARGARVSAQNVLGGIRGSRGSSNVVQNPPDAEDTRKRLEKLAQSYMSNVDLARRKADESRVRIQQLLIERDTMVNSLMEDIINKPPRTQGKRVQEMRLKLMDIDKQLGVYKAEYDVYASSVSEQSGLLRNLAAFGANAPNFAPGGQIDPRRLPGAPSVSSPSGGGSGGRGNVIPTSWIDAFELLQIVPRAFAATIKTWGEFSSAREWGQAFMKFENDLDRYVNALKKEEKQSLRSAAELLNERRKSITDNGFTDVNTETLVLMDAYAGALDIESSELVARGEKGELSLGLEVMSDLRRTREDARSALLSLEKINLEYRDAYPLRQDDNDEAWIALIPSLLID